MPIEKVVQWLWDRNFILDPADTIELYLWIQVESLPIVIFKENQSWTVSLDMREVDNKKYQLDQCFIIKKNFSDWASAALWCRKQFAPEKSELNIHLIGGIFK